ITYNSAENGGNGANQAVETKYGSAVSLPSATKNNWNFLGWNGNANATSGINSYTMPQANVTLFAIFSKELSLNFQDIGGVTKTLKVVIYNKATSGKVTLPALGEPTAPWEKDGWSNSPTPDANRINRVFTAQDITLDSSNSGQTWYACYKNILTATYNTVANGGSGNVAQTNVTAYYNGGRISKPTMTLSRDIASKNAWDFVGWNMNENEKVGVTEIASVTVDFTVYAIYKRDLTVKMFSQNLSVPQTALTYTLWNKEVSHDFTLQTPQATEGSGW
ncbi:MAG: InlB B-repeat-containing protein, partial [Clostridia bacterium]